MEYSMNKRVLIVNKFYYNRGGDCVCALNLEKLLKSKGIDVAIYSMRFDENFNSEFSEYFVSTVNFCGGIKSKIKALKRVFGSGDIIKSFTKILADFKPDIVHLHNVHSYISPVVAGLAKSKGCKVVWTLHDFKLICPAYNCLNNGQPCELCFKDKSSVVKNKCMKGSFTASLVAYFEAKRWNRNVLERMTDYFICPSEFIAKKMISCGFNSDKIKIINNFINKDKIQTGNILNPIEQRDYYLYVGRISTEKGIETLLKVAAKLPYKLKILGGGPLYDKLISKYKTYQNIEFMGHVDSNMVYELVEGARFTVLPSECYENNPLSVIESMSLGTPVVGSNIGGIPELINENNGIIFESGNENDLANAIDMAYSKSWDINEIRNNALSRFSSEIHYNRLIELYK